MLDSPILQLAAIIAVYFIGLAVFIRELRHQRRHILAAITSRPAEDDRIDVRLKRYLAKNHCNLRFAWAWPVLSFVMVFE